MLKTKYYFVNIKQKKFYVLYEDLYVLKAFEKRELFLNLDSFHINYIDLDNLKIVKQISFPDNRYSEFLSKGIIINMIKRNVQK